jgi:protein-tyrosine phosphatase
MNINIMAASTLIDFHAHILPGMDHGCNDVAMSIRQLRMAADHRIDIVIATSHFYPHLETVESFLRRRGDAWEKLKSDKMNEIPNIKLGAEVLICSNIDRMNGIEDLCIEKSKALLIEMPLIRQWETNLIETVVRLRDEKGLDIIVAHGERYPVKEMEKLLERGFRIQLNVSSIAHLYPFSFVKKYIERNQVVAFGSDIHGLRNNYKDFTRAIRKLGVQAEQIMEKTRILLDGK